MTLEEMEKDAEEILFSSMNMLGVDYSGIRVSITPNRESVSLCLPDGRWLELIERGRTYGKLDEEQGKDFQGKSADSDNE